MSSPSSGASPAPPKLQRAELRASPLYASSPNAHAPSLLGSAFSAIATSLTGLSPTAPAAPAQRPAAPAPSRGRSPGATGRGLHSYRGPENGAVSGAGRPALVGDSPVMMAPPAKSRAEVIEAAFDTGLWF